MFSNVSSTRNIVFLIIGMLKQCFETIGQTNNTLKFVRASVPQKVFPIFPTLGNMTNY